MRWLFATLAFGLALLAYGYAKADWQVHMEVAGVWIPAVSMKGYTAKIFADDESYKCAWSLVEVSYGVASGTRLQCRRIQRPAAPPSR